MLKAIKIALFVFLFGFFISIVAAMLFTSGESSDIIIFTILYTAAVLAGCTSLIIQVIKEK